LRVSVIYFFPVSESSDHNNVTFHVEQDSVIAHPQSINGIGVMQSFDVAVQTRLQLVDLSQDLFSDFIWQDSKSAGAVGPYSIR